MNDEDILMKFSELQRQKDGNIVFNWNSVLKLMQIARQDERERMKELIEKEVSYLRKENERLRKGIKKIRNDVYDEIMKGDD